MNRLLSTLLAVPLSLAAFAACQAAADAAVAAPGVIPRPQIERYGQGARKLVESSAGVGVSFQGIGLSESPALRAGAGLLARRVERLGGKFVMAEGTQAGQIVVERCDEREMAAILQRCGSEGGLSGKRLAQAYVLECGPGADGSARVRIRASNGLGGYYAMVSLCQLMDRGDGGGIMLPAVEIADWPAIGLRLAKTSASSNPLSVLRRFTEWMPLYKINLVGLQYHGENSREPGAFTENVKAICSEADEQGLLETIVYFCPFRGEGYDFNLPADRRKYAGLLQWFLSQGADGVEVDYNDWPGKGTPIEDVINLACEAVAAQNPQAYVLYCPPNRGDSQYRGPASAEMRRILSKVPANVWPLWTGAATLIEKPLEAQQVEEWTRAAGRRPFLWVNRVSARVERAFAQTVEEPPGALVFRGELLPKDLDRLFEGVHFNAGFSSRYMDLPEAFDAEALAYMATAADYVWNPRGSEAGESARRAQRFVAIMQALVGQ